MRLCIGLQHVLSNREEPLFFGRRHPVSERAYTWGPCPAGNDRWNFRLWAPGCESLGLRLSGSHIEMKPEPDGWYGVVAQAEVGAHYEFVLPDGSRVPDPASRRQANDVHGPSVLTAPRRSPFWRGRAWEEAVIYELHVGTFTREGTFRAAIAEFERLAGLGVTVLEIMPIAQSGGERGWGYDGVLPYAPMPSYGSPEDLVALVEAAHAHGLMVMLDVVYNHFGPDGNYLHTYAPDFFDNERHTPWGSGIDYRQTPVRRFFIENALYWLSEFGFDGLRLDAIDQIVDQSDPELLVELPREIRDRLPDRPVHLTTEDNRNVAHLHVRDDNNAPRLYSGEWNDDFHNAAHVVATGEKEGYFRFFAKEPVGHLGRALAEGFARQGEEGRGEPSAHLPPSAFINFLQNHDQTGNRAHGERLVSLADPEMMQALTAILLLSPHIPLLFMGEEYGETRPFYFFAGFQGDLAAAVREGRRREFADFSGHAGETVPDPIALETFEASKLDSLCRVSSEGVAAQERTAKLLDLRHRLIVPRLAGTSGEAGRLLTTRDGGLAVDWSLDGAVLQLRANLSDRPIALPGTDGDEIHRTGLPGSPRSAVHWLRIVT